jgi:UDP-3-O-[3-hydroxymyristoyl] N-acetylglucosamine deacetylase
MIGQRTLKNTIRATGVGLHTGEQVYLTLRPAPVDTGIVFTRTDLDPVVSIPARVEHVGATEPSVTLVRDEVRIASISHLMAAFAGLGVDNVYVELTASEVPIMDGSAAPFVFLVQAAGLEEQDAPKRFLRVRRSVGLNGEAPGLSLAPHEGCRLSIDLDTDHPALAAHSGCASLDLAESSFVKEVARARTFGFLAGAAPADTEPSASHASGRPAGPGPLRQHDELLKHAMLDAVGDLYLLGGGLVGAYSGPGRGHDGTLRLLRRLLAETDAWEWVTYEDAAHAPVSSSARPALPA